MPYGSAYGGMPMGGINGFNNGFGPYAGGMGSMASPYGYNNGGIRFGGVGGGMRFGF
jgi:hypothetical protein